MINLAISLKDNSLTRRELTTLPNAGSIPGDHGVNWELPGRVSSTKQYRLIAIDRDGKHTPSIKYPKCTLEWLCGQLLEQSLPVIESWVRPCKIRKADNAGNGRVRVSKISRFLSHGPHLGRRQGIILSANS